ncbi:LpqB family beta-propeller domain-containing protein [Planomonospora parontospora]|uniref:LpqB family beta-propeller domain-containing protein n=1 Tax=Planomonospora parontospora TaxID=58119 RepID=UPI00166FBCAC|nr:LpqB family beta-propeller domain-containing protein [Planomonospora parontospora]GGL08955.1 lipoprotein LpqB [Planomonospora parontospora subsp. antibiotica]GII14468.1 lipoprotein LpqB [Planomonospora parontospora subsp. antibiotica]
MRTSRTRRCAGAVLLAAALSWSAAACSVVPTGRSTVVEDRDQGNPLDPPYARVIAMEPNPSWTPEQVVTGFRAAMASIGDVRYAAARRYLTDDFAARWKPETGVTVYQPAPSVTAPLAEGATEARVTLKGAVTASIDQDGQYRPRGGTLDELFTLVKGPKGWRISAGPDGLLLSQADVERAYEPVDLYFLDAKRQGLVVDRVQMPVDPASTLAKTTVERLIKGPSGSLRGAVETAFDAGTGLIDVTTENNRVVVDLTEGVPAARVAAMSAQLAGTLSKLAGGSSFEVRVNGEPYRSGVPLHIDAQEHLRFDRWMAPVDAAPYYLQDGALRVLGKENVGGPVPGGAGREYAGSPAAAPAVSGSAPRHVAAVSEDGRRISVAPLTPDGQWEQWTVGNDLVPPSWDRYDSMWTVDRTGPQTSVVLRQYADDRRQYRVAAPELDTVEVTALKVARDGVRVAVAVKDGTGEKVMIGAIVGDRADSRIGNLQIAMDGDEKQTIEDIAWKDGTALYVLTGKSELFEASLIAEPSQSIPSPPGIRSIAALNKNNSLLAGVEDDDGKLQVLYWDGDTWEPQVKDGKGAAVLGRDGPAFPAFPLG